MMKKGIHNIFNKYENLDWFDSLIEDIFAKKKRPNRAIDYFYASWAGDCPRAIQYSMKGLGTNDIDPQGQRRMDNGNYMHTRFGDYFQESGNLVAREPAFKKDFEGVFISGRGDIIITKEIINNSIIKHTDVASNVDRLNNSLINNTAQVDNSNKCLIEIKSINANGFKTVLIHPKEGDVLQWNLCSKALDISDGIILYENKDSQEIRKHFVTFDQSKYDLVLNDFKEIDRCNKLGILVSKPEKCLNSYWCNFKNICV